MATMETFTLQYLKDRLAQANTSYNIRAGLVIQGTQLQYEQDRDLPNMGNGREIDTTTPPGFQIIKVVNESRLNSRQMSRVETRPSQTPERGYQCTGLRV